MSGRMRSVCYAACQLWCITYVAAMSLFVFMHGASCSLSTSLVQYLSAACIWGLLLAALTNNLVTASGLMSVFVRGTARSQCIISVSFEIDNRA
jgi:hypothetical protein